VWRRRVAAFGGGGAFALGGGFGAGVGQVGFGSPQQSLVGLCLQSGLVGLLGGGGELGPAPVLGGTCAVGGLLGGGAGFLQALQCPV
jgi:hypothetical protein